MEKTPSPIELPKASEKLASKFILDALYERNFSESYSENHGSVLAGLGASGEEGSRLSVEITTGAVPSHENENFFQDLLSLPKDKKYFRIGETAELLEVEPYVLRYWESEFPAIKPMKSQSGHRVYSRKDVQTFGRIKQLLYTEKFSIKGAKKKLQEIRRQSPSTADPMRQKQQQNLKKLAHELKELIQLVKTNPGTL